MGALEQTGNVGATPAPRRAPTAVRATARRPRRTRCGVALLAVVSSLAGRAAAEPPPGRMTGLLGVRIGSQAFDDAYGQARLVGLEAAWEPLSPGQRLGYAIHWNVLWGDYGADEAALTGELDVVELALGARLRLIPAGDTRRSLFLGGGVALLRANNPLPPDDAKDYVGGFAGGGISQFVADRLVLTMELRYGLLGAGPGSLSVLVGVGLGS